MNKHIWCSSNVRLVTIQQKYSISVSTFTYVTNTFVYCLLLYIQLCLVDASASCLFVYGIPMSPTLFTVLGMSINSGQRLFIQ